MQCEGTMSGRDKENSYSSQKLTQVLTQVCIRRATPLNANTLSPLIRISILGVCFMVVALLGSSASMASFRLSYKARLENQ